MYPRKSTLCRVSELLRRSQPTRFLREQGETFRANRKIPTITARKCRVHRLRISRHTNDFGPTANIVRLRHGDCTLGHPQPSEPCINSIALPIQRPMIPPLSPPENAPPEGTSTAPAGGSGAVVPFDRLLVAMLPVGRNESVRDAILADTNSAPQPNTGAEAPPFDRPAGLVTDTTDPSQLQTPVFRDSTPGDGALPPNFCAPCAQVRGTRLTDATRPASTGGRSAASATGRTSPASEEGRLDPVVMQRQRAQTSRKPGETQQDANQRREVSASETMVQPSLALRVMMDGEPRAAEGPQNPSMLDSEPPRQPTAPALPAIPANPTSARDQGEAPGGERQGNNDAASDHEPSRVASLEGGGPVATRTYRVPPPHFELPGNFATNRPPLESAAAPAPSRVTKPPLDESVHSKRESVDTRAPSPADGPMPKLSSDQATTSVVQRSPMVDAPSHGSERNTPDPLAPLPPQNAEAAGPSAVGPPAATAEPSLESYSAEFPELRIESASRPRQGLEGHPQSTASGRAATVSLVGSTAWTPDGTATRRSAAQEKQQESAGRTNRLVRPNIEVPWITGVHGGPRELQQTPIARDTVARPRPIHPPSPMIPGANDLQDEPTAAGRPERATSEIPSGPRGRRPGGEAMQRAHQTKPPSRTSASLAPPSAAGGARREGDPVEQGAMSGSRRSFARVLPTNVPTFEPRLPSSPFHGENGTIAMRIAGEAESISGSRASDAGLPQAAQAPGASEATLGRRTAGRAARRAGDAGTEGTRSVSGQNPLAVPSWWESASRTHAPDPTPTPLAEPPASIVAQVADRLVVKARLASQDHRTWLEIQLQPPELGRVVIRLERFADQRINALLVASEPIARTVLERGLAELRQTLEQNGIPLNQLNVIDTEERHHARIAAQRDSARLGSRRAGSESRGRQGAVHHGSGNVDVKV